MDAHFMLPLWSTNDVKVAGCFPDAPFFSWP
ncbi:hypothetical protein CD178_00420 [Komagataeibacter saccharivorans]|uniref:Uncharacterized protein n=1 Tax=Komagataeibacter saccharivorans TaxID=265959 RepID=A0A347W8P6_9PROT|nr:hypothetical protein CD178_00420 [Komagataeibacter saccharivorans]QBL94865.1 hypothetical protein KSAC_26790 [Komagataeibacter saccharivorans]